MAAAALCKPRHKPNLAAESVRVSLSENIRSPGLCLSDKQREGGCLLIESVIMSPPFFFYLPSQSICVPATLSQYRTALSGRLREDVYEKTHGCLWILCLFVCFSVL